MADNSTPGQDNGIDAGAEIDRMAAEGATDTLAVDPSTALASEVAELRCERDALHDRLLRQAADFDNYRKRNERDRRDTAEYAATRLLQELLPIVDDFERALQTAAGPGADSYRQGVEIIHRQVMEFLSRRGVTPIEALGADFDPHIHEAVEYEDAPDHREGEVIAELRRGYRLGDRLLRPALVKVAKA